MLEPDLSSFPMSSRKSRGLGFASTSTHVRIPHKTSTTGHSILHDNFLSFRTTGIRSSVAYFFGQLEYLCRLHGLGDTNTACLRDKKAKLIYHLMSGDCFSSRCTDSAACPDRSACLSVASGFTSSSITTFLVSLLKDTSPSDLSTDDLLFIVDSLGIVKPMPIA